MEAFRANLRKYYGKNKYSEEFVMIIIFSCITGLEPFHYVSLPSFSWDAGLLKTGEKLEVIRDIDKCLFIDRLVDIYQVINNDNI